MKRIFFLLAAAALLLSGCASMRLTPEEKAMIERQVQENLDDRNFIIDVDQMLPSRGISQHVDNYSIKVDGETLDSHLPYVGQAWSLPYGGGKGLTFESKITDYIESYPKTDRRQIVLSTDNGEDVLVYIMEIFTNGRTSIEVRSRQRERIRYYGNVRTNLGAQ